MWHFRFVGDQLQQHGTVVLDWLWAMSQIVSDIKVPDFFVCLERRVRLLLYSLMQIYILLHLIFSSLLIYFSCVFRM